MAQPALEPAHDGHGEIDKSPGHAGPADYFGGQDEQGQGHQAKTSSWEKMRCRHNLEIGQLVAKKKETVETAPIR